MAHPIDGGESRKFSRSNTPPYLREVSLSKVVVLCVVCPRIKKTQLYTFSQSISTSQQTRTSTVSGIVTTPGYRNSRASNRLVAMQTRKFGSVARSLRSGKPALRFRGHESGTDCNIHLLIRSSCPSSESATRQWRSHEDIPRKKAAVLFPKLIITSNSNLFLHL